MRRVLVSGTIGVDDKVCKLMKISTFKPYYFRGSL